MYSNISKGIYVVIFSLFTYSISLAKAEDNTRIANEIAFSVQPQQCVTLRQGRDCYATIKVAWQKVTEQALCLYQVNTKQPNAQKKLTCWPKSKKGQASVSFESSDNLTYQLRTVADKMLVAEAEMVVSWVHKSTTRKRRWRLF